MSEATFDRNLDLPPFKQRFPWWGGDLQTIRTALPPTPRPIVSQEMRFHLDEKNTLIAMLDRPTQPNTGKPLALLIHGVPGSQDSPYLLRMSDRLLKLGHCVLRLNLRGAGPSRSVCAGQYYAGSSGDIASVLAQLASEKHLIEYGIAAVGYSIGGAILLKYLGEQGKQDRQGKDTLIRAAASVSAPIDLRDTCLTLMRFRNTLYHWYILSRIKREALGKGAELTDHERHNIKMSRNLWEYDELFTARRNGFRDAADYYDRCSAINFLQYIQVPTLALTSLDDPWVPSGAYLGHYWGSNKSLSVKPLLSPGGGHVGFHGSGQAYLWSDMAIAKFFSG